jgi:hypothetical protein
MQRRHLGGICRQDAGATTETLSRYFLDITLAVGGKQVEKAFYMSEPVKGPEHPGRGYEDSDVSLGRLFAFAGGVVALIVLGVLGSAAVFHFFVRHQPLGPPASPFEDVRTMPPEPRLQTTAPLDLKSYRNGQEKTLEGYGWVDSQAGVVRIPVDRAMDLLLQKGYPVRGSSAAEGARAKTSGPAAPPANHQTAPTPVGAEGKP